MFNKGIVINITALITKLYGENIVKFVEIVSVTAPAVAVAKSGPAVANFKGMDPEIPACHTTKPEYAEAIKSL